MFRCVGNTEAAADKKLLCSAVNDDVLIFIMWPFKPNNNFNFKCSEPNYLDRDGRRKSKELIPLNVYKFWLQMSCSQWSETKKRNKKKYWFLPQSGDSKQIPKSTVNKHTKTKIKPELWAATCWRYQLWHLWKSEGKVLNTLRAQDSQKNISGLKEICEEQWVSEEWPFEERLFFSLCVCCMAYIYSFSHKTHKICHLLKFLPPSVRLNTVEGFTAKEPDISFRS